MLALQHVTTDWQPRAPGETTPACHRVAERGMERLGGREEDGMRAKRRVCVVDHIPSARPWRVAGGAGPGAPAQADAPAEAGPVPDSAGGSAALWLLHGPLDPEAGGQGNRGALRGGLPFQPHVAVPAEPGLERPEAREAGPGARREGHRPLESLQGAAYKKRPHVVRPTSFSSTRTAFSSSPPSGSPGHPAPAPRSGDEPGNRPRAGPS